MSGDKIIEGLNEALEHAKGNAKGLHHWFPKFGLICCKHCGIIRRADGKNKPCPGKVRVVLRENRTKP